MNDEYVTYPLHEYEGCFGPIVPAEDDKAICCKCKVVFVPEDEKREKMLRAHAAAGLTLPIKVGKPQSKPKPTAHPGYVDMFDGGLAAVAPMRVDLIQQTARAARKKK